MAYSNQSAVYPAAPSQPEQAESSRKPIIFYTSRIASSCRAVQMVVTHLNIPYQEVHLRCFVETRNEEFIKINPCHTLPVIDDNGFILWESRAIMQYLCNKYAPDSDLYPKDAQKRATVDRLLNFDLKTLSHAVMAIHYEFMFPSEYSASRGEKLIAVTDAMTLLEIFLINKNYVAGNHLTIADITILASVTFLEIAVEFDLTSYPNIWTWFNRLRNELSYYDPLTTKAHIEFKTMMQSVRDAHEEWSSPMHQCAFVPNGALNSSCIEEQRRQYQRLFLNPSDQQDAVRIMAAISPVFRKSLNNNNDINSETYSTSNRNLFQNGYNRSSGNYSNLSKPKTNQNKRMAQTFSNEHTNQNSSMKRIRLTIEPNMGQLLQLAHLESPQPLLEPNWGYSVATPAGVPFYFNNNSSDNLNCDNNDSFRLNYLESPLSTEGSVTHSNLLSSLSSPVQSSSSYTLYGSSDVLNPNGTCFAGCCAGGQLSDVSNNNSLQVQTSIDSVSSPATHPNDKSGCFLENYELCNETSCHN